MQPKQASDSSQQYDLRSLVLPTSGAAAGYHSVLSAERRRRRYDGDVAERSCAVAATYSAGNSFDVEGIRTVRYVGEGNERRLGEGTESLSSVLSRTSSAGGESVQRSIEYDKCNCWAGRSGRRCGQAPSVQSTHCSHGSSSSSSSDDASVFSPPEQRDFPSDLYHRPRLGHDGGIAPLHPTDLSSGSQPHRCGNPPSNYVSYQRDFAARTGPSGTTTPGAGTMNDALMLGRSPSASTQAWQQAIKNAPGISAQVSSQSQQTRSTSGSMQACRPPSWNSPGVSTPGSSQLELQQRDWPTPAPVHAWQPTNQTSQFRSANASSRPEQQRWQESVSASVARARRPVAAGTVTADILATGMEQYAALSNSAHSPDGHAARRFDAPFAVGSDEECHAVDQRSVDTACNAVDAVDGSLDKLIIQNSQRSDDQKIDPASVSHGSSHSSRESSITVQSMVSMDDAIPKRHSECQSAASSQPRRHQTAEPLSPREKISNSDVHRVATKQMPAAQPSPQGKAASKENPNGEKLKQLLLHMKNTESPELVSIIDQFRERQASPNSMKKTFGDGKTDVQKAMFPPEEEARNGASIDGVGNGVAAPTPPRSPRRPVCHSAPPPRVGGSQMPRSATQTGNSIREASPSHGPARRAVDNGGGDLAGEGLDPWKMFPADPAEGVLRLGRADDTIALCYDEDLITRAEKAELASVYGFSDIHRHARLLEMISTANPTEEGFKTFVHVIWRKGGPYRRFARSLKERAMQNGIRNWAKYAPG